MTIYNCCCCHMKFYWAFFIIFVYEIIGHLLSIFIIDDKKLVYNCGKNISDYLKKISYYFNTFKFISYFSIGCIILSLLFSIWLKLIDKKNNNNDIKSPSEIQSSLPVEFGIQQPINNKQTYLNNNNLYLI